MFRVSFSNDFHQVTNFLDHPSDFRRILQGDYFVQSIEVESIEDSPLLWGSANSTLDQPDAKGFRRFDHRIPLPVLKDLPNLFPPFLGYLLGGV